MTDEFTPIDVGEYLSTPIDRHEGTDRQTITAACPIHGRVDFEYNVPMNAWFCKHYCWDPSDRHPGECCDALVMAADMANDPDGGPVRHRRTMGLVTEEEYLASSFSVVKDYVEQPKITDRKEPTAPPGFAKTIADTSNPIDGYYQ